MGQHILIYLSAYCEPLPRIWKGSYLGGGGGLQLPARWNQQSVTTKYRSMFVAKYTLQVGYFNYLTSHINLGMVKS